MLNVGCADKLLGRCHRSVRGPTEAPVKHRLRAETSMRLAPTRLPGLRSQGKGPDWAAHSALAAAHEGTVALQEGIISAQFITSTVLPR